MKLFKVLASLVLFCSPFAQGNIITIGTFTGGDQGEGLDFEGNFEYAVNMRGSGGFTIGDANFTDDQVAGVSYTATMEILSWGTLNNFGSTTNDDNLEYLMHSIRYSLADNGKEDVLTVDLDGLTVGAEYSLQMFFVERCCDRGFDVQVEGSTIADDFAPIDYNGSHTSTDKGVFIRYDFSANDTVLNIAMGGTAPNPDNNPILQGFTLERVSDVPAPGSLLLMTLGLVALAKRKSN